MGELELLYMAMSTPLGIAVGVSDFQLAQQRLYAARRKAQDESLACLQFRRTPDPTELWIVKGSLPNAKA